jgi:PPP family 3-phenylpropionic acid transporter
MFLIAGKLLSRFNVKLLFSICLLFTAARWLAQGYFVDVVPLLILTQCIHALSYGLMHSASIYFIGQHFAMSQQNRGQFMYLGVTFGIGGSAGAWLTGKTWLGGTGSTDTFLWAATAAFIAALLILITPRRNFQFLQHTSSV